MLTFRPITPNDREAVLPMVHGFYHSDAVLHPVDQTVVERTFRAVADPEEPLLWGFLILEDGQTAGFLYLTHCYAAEVGGRCIFLEELFLKPEFQGRGLGREVMTWLHAQYPDARRFRLEVNNTNHSAVRLYQKVGYDYLRYDQMVIDRPD